MDDPSLQLLKQARDLARADEFSGAEEILRGLLSQFPREAAIHSEIAHVKILQGDVTAAIAAISEAIAVNPVEPAYFFTRSRMNIRAMRYHEAIDDCSETIRLSAHYQSDYYVEAAFFFRAEAFLRLGDFENARADCAHVQDGFRWWIDRLRTKEDVLAECQSRCARPGGNDDRAPVLE